MACRRWFPTVPTVQVTKQPEAPKSAWLASSYTCHDSITLTDFFNPASGKISSMYRCNSAHWCCSAGISNVTSCCQDNVPQFRLRYLDFITNGSGKAFDGSLVVSQAPLQQTSITSPSSSQSTAIANSSSFGTSVAGCPSQRPGSANVVATACNSHSLGVGLGMGLGIGIPLLAAFGNTILLYLREERANQKFKKDLTSEPLDYVIKKARSADSSPHELSAHIVL